MGTTGHGLVYPENTDAPEVWADMQALAESVETALDTYETWTPWTLLYSGLGGFTAYGSGGLGEGHYMQIGKLVHAEFRIELGTGFTTSGTVIEIDLPVTAYQWGGAGNMAAIGSWIHRDDSVPDHYAGTIGIAGGSSTSMHLCGAWNATSPRSRVSSSSIPVAFAAGDVLSGQLSYRAE